MLALLIVFSLISSVKYLTLIDMASKILRMTWGGADFAPPPSISESRHHSTTKISQNNLLHVNLPFCIKNALYFMPTAWIGLIGLKYEISLIFDRGVIQPPNFYRTFIYHWAFDISRLLELCFSVRNLPEVGTVREEISGQMDYTLTWRGGGAGVGVEEGKAFPND